MTPKQQRFAELVAEGKTQTAAYREAYDAEGMKPSSIASEASRLMEHPEISRFIADARAEARRTATWCLGLAVERLEQLNGKCLDELLNGTKVHPAALRGFIDSLRELNRLCNVSDEVEADSFESFVRQLTR